MRPWWRHSEPDPELGAALSQLDSAPDPDELDAMRVRIVTAARTRLAQLRSPSPRWWEWISAWSRVALTAGLAASLGAALLLQGATSSALDNANADVGSDSTLVAAAFSEPGNSDVADYLVAPGGNDWLLEQAVIQ